MDRSGSERTPGVNPSSAPLGAQAALPLGGVRVLDLTSVMLGPYATQMLGDYGADVIKVESPAGDTTRQTGPAKEPGMAAAFLGANRSKRSVVLDLKQPAAREALMRLVDDADVLIYSMRPQKMAALGLSPEALRARNSRLIVAAVHGFAEAGPYAGRPAYDDIIQGLSGLASLSESISGRPAYLPSVVADKTCGLFAVQAILMALFSRERSGEGCYVEVPMFESMVNFTLVEHQYGKHFRPALGAPGYPRLLNEWRRPYATRDGHICVVPYTDGHWQRFFAEVGRSDLLADPRFHGIAARTQNIAQLYAELANSLLSRTTAEWLEICDRIDVPAAPLRRLQDLEADPHLVETGFFVELEDGAMGTLVFPGAPVRFEGRVPTPTLPPRLGEHTVEVLVQSGFSRGEIDGLMTPGGAIQNANAHLQ